MSADEKPTVELPAVPAWAIELTKEVKGARADIGLVANDVSIVKDRVAVVESRVLSLEEARKVNSMRAQQSSSIDLEHESKLAAEIVARTELAAKVDALAVGHSELSDKADKLDSKQDMQLAILGRLDKVASNPLVKTVAAMLATALVTWLASHGVHVPQ